jgi:signal peptidase I
MLDATGRTPQKPQRAFSGPKEGRNAPSMTAKSETRDFLWFLVKLGLFVFILRSFIVSPFNIPSESMQPRLLIGDYLLVAKWPYGYSRYSLPFSVPLIPGRIFASTPQRGDVVVFKAPPNQKNDYIKRVIGLPGDMIAVRGGTVYLNGQAIPKQKVADFVIPVTPNMVDAADKEGAPSPCYRPNFEEAAPGGGRQCRYPQYRETLPGGKSYNVLDLVPDGAADDRDTVLVPEGHLFMMGDNRDRSADSRFPAVEGGGIGLVPEKNLVGKALVSVFSTDGSANWLLPWTWFTAARWSRIGEGF